MNRGAQIEVTLRKLSPHIEVLALTSLLMLFVFKSLIPAWISLRSDFPNYYIVARLLREHYSMDRIYEWIWFQRVKDHWLVPQPLVGFVGLTPFSALPLVPLTWLDALEAKRVWLAVNLGVLAATLYGMQRITSLGARRIALIAFLAIIPVRNNFLLGQMHLVLLALLVLAFYLYAQNKWLQCSLVLSIAASLKIYPLFFVFFFLRKREWKPAAVLAGATLAIFVACFWIFGEPVMHTFLAEQFPRMLRGEATDPFSLTAPSASSLFHRIFLSQAEVNPNPLFPSPLIYSILYPLWQLCVLAATLLTISPKEEDQKRKSLEWAAWICMLLALSTEPASYHRVALILVAVFAVRATESLRDRAIVLGCYFVACNMHRGVTAQHPVLALLIDFIPYWATVAMLICLLALLSTGRFAAAGTLFPTPLWPRMRIAWALAVFATVWAAVSTTTFVHARTLNNPSYRVDRTSAAFAHFSPRVAGNHVLSIGMFFEGYRVEREDGVRYPTFESGIEDDQLAIASSPKNNRLWIEAVNGRQSRLVELDALSGGVAAAPIATIFDAESPALSLDSENLLFLRENKGTSRAWFVRLDKNGQPVSTPTPTSPQGMDVRDARFSASNAILLSVAEKGSLHLFEMRDGVAQRLFSNDDSMLSPVANAESNVLVRQQQKGGYWRLIRSDPRGDDETQLTFGDCNAYDPAWFDESRLVYISDCGRGAGFGGLAEINTEVDDGKGGGPLASAPRTGGPRGESKE
jgi:hypothetical protein